MASFDVEIQDLETRGDFAVEGGFVGTVRSLGSNNFKVGDIFLIPEKYKVYQNAQLTTDPEKPVLYTLVEMLTPKKESTGKARQFYPTALMKTVWGYKKDENTGECVRDREAANGLGYIICGGRVVDEFQKHNDIESAMKAIAGKPIKISNVRTITTRSFDKNEHGDYDLVEGKAFVFEWA